MFGPAATSSRNANRRMLVKAVAALAQLSLLSLTGTSALAGDTGTLTITGTIAPSCGLTGPGAAVDLGNIGAAGSHQFDVTVNCNTPFAYALVSTNHALTAASPPSVIDGTFDATLPYTLTTSFATDGASFGNSDIASADLTDTNAAPCLAPSYDASGCAAHFADSGATVAIDKTGTLTVTWGAAAHPLVSGTFTDTIVLTVRAI